MEFKVWINGNHYYEDEEYEVEIELSDEECATIKQIVKEYDGNISRGLMPILKKCDDKLYQLFYNEVYPEVFYTLFQRDPCFESVPGDENKSWSSCDIDYLMKTYGDNYCFDDSYIVYIPDEIMPPKIKVSKGMSKDELLIYIRKWNSMREDIFDWVTSYHSIPNNMHDKLFEIIENRLLEIAEKNIEEWDEEYLSNGKNDPFRQDWTEKIADEVYKEFKTVSN